MRTLSILFLSLLTLSLNAKTASADESCYCQDSEALAGVGTVILFFDNVNIGMFQYDNSQDPSSKREAFRSCRQAQFLKCASSTPAGLDAQ